LRTIFGFIGVAEINSIAVEYDEFSDERGERSMVEAEAKLEALVRTMAAAAARAVKAA
jgi:FMN-dependent NADH-azoreductase